MRGSFNPDARCFTPADQPPQREHFFNHFDGQAQVQQFPPLFAPPMHHSFMPRGPPPLPPPPPPQQLLYHSDQQAFLAAKAEEQAHAHARAHHQHWAPHHGSPAYQGPRQGPPPLPFGASPYGFPPQPPHLNRPPPFGFGPPPQNFPQRGYHSMATQSHMNIPYGGVNEEIQTSTLPGKKAKPGKPGKSQKQQQEIPPEPKEPASSKKGRYGDNKIMLPAPQPTTEYLAQAAEQPVTVDTQSEILVILDLNGTLLFRPNRNAKTMIERPFLKPFLRYLFQNFKVMVWSSAKPDNVKSLVSQSLDNTLRSQLVAQWARDSFGLSPANYGQNVQVYKNLKLVWSRDVIQQHHREYSTGGRFGQHNTVLIDDSVLKANAQPSNLLEIPEFAATPEQMTGDVLREVAGYLEILKEQQDVSKFINKEPFKNDGRWCYDWPDEIAGVGEITSSASVKKNKKKNKKRAMVADSDRARSATPQASVAQTVESMSAISLAPPLQSDW